MTGPILSLRGGLKATLGRLGRVPRELLTDHSSTATHQLKRDGSERGFNEEYLAICAHYGITPRTIVFGTAVRFSMPRLMVENTDAVSYA